MSAWRRLALAVGLLFSLAVLVSLSVAGWRTIPEGEVAARVERSKPRWPTYQEDVKAQVGAKLVAEWEGRPISAQSAENYLDVTFALRGPWTTRSATMPILLRTPEGQVIQGESDKVPGGTRSYRFRTGSASALGWAELQYPGREERLLLDGEGQWRAAE